MSTQRKELPILFSTEMVQAILAGRKTETRRVVKFNKCIDNPMIGFTTFTPDGYFSVRGTHENGSFGESFFRLPYGKKGDILWVREMLHQNGELGLEYVANREWIDEDIIPENYGPYGGEYSHRNIPSIHMPKWAARIWLEVTSVHCERLHDITEEGAIAEGVKLHERGKYYLNYTDRAGGLTQFIYNCYTAKESFCSLWNHIHNWRWRENPWVWVEKFKVLSTTGRPAHLISNN